MGGSAEGDGRVRWLGYGMGVLCPSEILQRAILAAHPQMFLARLQYYFTPVGRYRSRFFSLLPPMDTCFAGCLERGAFGALVSPRLRARVARVLDFAAKTRDKGGEVSLDSCSTGRRTILRVFLP